MFDNINRKERERLLTESLQDGNKEALSQIYDLYAPVLLGLIIRIIKDKEAAEKILQKAFLMVWEQKDVYDSTKTGLLTWLIMQAKEVAFEAVQFGDLNPVSNMSDFSKSYHGLTINPELENDFFCKLQPNEKAILDLIYLKGYNYKKAAEEMEIPVETLVKNLRMAIKNIGTPAAS